MRNRGAEELLVSSWAVSLTARMREVFTAPYRSQTDTYVKLAEEATMEPDVKTGKVTTTIQELAF
jgi:hypothetical protein